jgi:hypothetical protein
VPIGKNGIVNAIANKTTRWIILKPHSIKMKHRGSHSESDDALR